MDKPIISIISAISENRAIGKDNKLLWDIPEDLMRFRRITKGHPVIMGRKTFESIGRVLPQRLNIIITRDRNYSIKGAIIAGSLDEAIKKATSVIVNEAKPGTVQNPAKQSQPRRPAGQNKEIAVVVKGDLAMTKPEVFIIGGGQIYTQAIDIADKLYLTIVHKEIDGDTYFPDYSAFKKIVFENKRESNGYRYTFLELVK